jgi:hypothetical protein
MKTQDLNANVIQDILELVLTAMTSMNAKPEEIIVILTLNASIKLELIGAPVTLVITETGSSALT